MLRFAQLAEAVSQTSKKTQKTNLIAEYFRSQSVEEAALAALFLSGRVFPAHTETILNVGGAVLSRAILEVSGASGSELNAAYRRYGDLGAATFEVLAERKIRAAGLSLKAMEQYFVRIAAGSGPAVKGALVREMLSELSPLEAKYAVKIMSGDLRIGSRESLVEEAIAKAFEEEAGAVRRANMLLGDVGATLKLAAEHRLADARMKLFHPIGMMLASPVQNAEEAFTYFDDALVEDKFDGIRAQAHVDHGVAKLFSRTLDEVTGSFPEMAASLAQRVAGPVILDGEILAWREGRAMPFSALQQRLGRKVVSAELMREVPVAYVAFDVLFANGELLLEQPLRERGRVLDGLLSGAEVQGTFVVPKTKRKTRVAEAQSGLFAADEEDTVPLPPAVRAEVRAVASAEELDRMFDEAQARGNEGLMIKDAMSAYLPGRRGKSWLKLKRELATLDVVVTAAEWGHGKRAGVLSDVTFAVRDGQKLMNVGKAYSGLTDKEIAELTQWFLAHTLEDHGHVRTVEPKIVLEVAFNNVMESDRHESGYALRFPRILRLRPDKPVDEIDTVDRVREVFERQGVRVRE